MARSLASILASGVLLGTLGLAARADALTCAYGFRGGTYPGNATLTNVHEPVPVDSSIWTVCDPEYCSPPTLTSADDVTIPLEEAERWSRPNFGLGPAEVAVIRYRPSIPFELGATYHVRGSAFEIASTDVSPPALPRIKSQGYIRGGWTANTIAAHFLLEYPKGLLVADVAPADDDPRQSIAMDFWEAYDEPSSAEFSIGTDDCGGNFSAAAPGVSTQVRFGILDAAGRFSGWTRFYDITYPEQGVDLARKEFPPGDELPPPVDDRAVDEDGSSSGEATDGESQLPVGEPHDTVALGDLDPSSEAPSSAGSPAVVGGCALTAASPHAQSSAGWLVVAAAIASRYRRRARRAHE